MSPKSEWETETGKTRVTGGGAEVPGWPEIPAGLDVISVDVSSDSIPYYNTSIPDFCAC